MRRIKEKQDGVGGEAGSKQLINDLEISLDLGPPIVQGQYESDFRKFGVTYARGDGIVREQLKDVLITLQMAVLSNLTGVWMGIRTLDHKALQIASDDSRVNAVLCLFQWQQRLSSAATAQQQKSTSYPLGRSSRPMSPPLTNVSSHSDRSSLGAGRPLTPDATSDQMASLSMAARSPEPGYASSFSPGRSMAPNSHTLPQAGGRGDIDLPSPLFVRTRPSLGRQESLRSSDVAQAVPVRSPYRPSMPQPTSQPLPVPDTYSQDFPSPVSAMGPENEHFDSDDFDQSSLPRSLQSPSTNYTALYSPASHGTRRALSAASRNPRSQTTFSDHSTLEHVSVLESGGIHPASAHHTEQRKQQARKDSLTSGTPRSIPQRPPPPPPPPNPQWNPNQHTPSMPAPIPTPNQGPRRTTTTSSHSSTAPSTRPSLSLTLPEETNSYLGFCKGAYKLQIGLPRKKAFDIETRPAGMYSTFQVWRCKKCSFEGPISLTSALPSSGKKAGKPEKVFDPKVRMSKGGIAYRWAFLAKCHVTTKGTAEGVKDGSVGTFGCLFCSAEGMGRGWLDERDGLGAGAGAGVGAAAGRRGRGEVSNSTPMFGNVDSFMQHLGMHRTAEGMPGVEMQIRMKCVVGRMAEVGEDFDVNFPPPGLEE